MIEDEGKVPVMVTIEISQYKLGLLEGIEAFLTRRPTDWRASGLAPINRNPEWVPAPEMLKEFNVGIGDGLRLCRSAGIMWA